MARRSDTDGAGATASGPKGGLARLPGADRVLARLPWPVRVLGKLPVPARVVVAAVGVGVLTGLATAHVILAAWTYRDAARRGSGHPRAWGLVVLVGGLFAFGPYLLARGAALLAGDDREGGRGRAVRVARWGTWAARTWWRAARLAWRLAGRAVRAVRR